MTPLLATASWPRTKPVSQPSSVSLGVTIEDARILDIWRVISPGEVELYADATHDHGGSLTWQPYRCTSLDVERSEDDGVIYFGLGACDTPIHLESSPQV